jgi:hypothetical protein
VTGKDVLAPVTEPAFQIYTSFRPTLAEASSPWYEVLLDASVPATRGKFETKLVITGAPLDRVQPGTMQATCTGRTGHPIRAKVTFAPFKVYCQQHATWMPVIE